MWKFKTTNFRTKIVRWSLSLMMRSWIQTQVNVQASQCFSLNVVLLLDHLSIDDGWVLAAVRGRRVCVVGLTCRGLYGDELQGARGGVICIWRTEREFTHRETTNTSDHNAQCQSKGEQTVTLEPTQAMNHSHPTHEERLVTENVNSERLSLKPILLLSIAQDVWLHRVFLHFCDGECMRECHSINYSDILYHVSCTFIGSISAYCWVATFPAVKNSCSAFFSGYLSAWETETGAGLRAKRVGGDFCETPDRVCKESVK